MQRIAHFAQKDTLLAQNNTPFSPVSHIFASGKRTIDPMSIKHK